MVIGIKHTCERTAIEDSRCWTLVGMRFLAILCSVRVHLDKTTETGDRILAWLPESK